MQLRPSSWADRRLRLVLFAAAVLGAIIGLNALVLHTTTDPLADVRAYYDAGARLNAGQPLYGQAADTNDASFYRYPPLLAIAFRPLALLPYPVAAGIWEAFLVATFVLTLRRLGFRARTWLAVGMLGLPIAWSLAIGQAQVLVTALLVVATPGAVAFAAHIKLLPALAALYWLGRRDWRSLGRFAAWAAGLAIVQLVLEPAGTIAFLGFSSLTQVGQVNNLSPYAISPLLWAGLVAVGAVVTLRLAPTRFGWPAAIAFSVLATPRLLSYQLSTLLAALRRPDEDGR